MKKHLYFWLICLVMFQAEAQEKSVSLDSCLRWAKMNFPLLKQSELAQANSSLNVNAIHEAWLPKVNFLAQATYNSEVVAFNLPGNNFVFPHDSYLGALGIEQLLFDGGQASKLAQIENTSGQIEVKKNEIELYRLVDRVNQLYGSILLARANVDMLAIYMENLRSRQNNLGPAVANGVVLSSSLDELEAELLKSEQQLLEANANLKGLYGALSLLTKHTIGAQTVFILSPIGGKSKLQNFQRPDLEILNLQTQALDQKYQLAFKTALPRISLGLNGNYGRPGPNFINQDLRAFGSANLKLRWNASTLYGLNREKNRYSLQKDFIDMQRSNLMLALETQRTQLESQIEAATELLAKDKEIIDKRARIAAVYASQLENGKITVSTYLIQLNEEMAAKLNQQIHEIKLMNAQSSYNANMGIQNF
jgi:outer membrane protein TolC